MAIATPGLRLLQPIRARGPRTGEHPLYHSWRYYRCSRCHGYAILWAAGEEESFDKTDWLKTVRNCPRGGLWKLSRRQLSWLN